MRVTRFNRSGFELDASDSLLPPVLENERVSYVEYAGKTVRVVTAVERAREGALSERIVAVVHGRKVELLGELPPRIAERIGEDSSSAVAAKNRVC